MIRYYVQYKLFHPDGRSVQSFMGLSEFRSQYYATKSNAKKCMYDSISLLEVNGFDIISPEGALSPKLMCPDGLHVIRLEVVRCSDL